MGSERMTQRDDDVASSRPGIEPVPLVLEAWNSNRFPSRRLPWLSILNIAVCPHIFQFHLFFLHVYINIVSIFLNKSIHQAIHFIEFEKMSFTNS